MQREDYVTTQGEDKPKGEAAEEIKPDGMLISDFQPSGL